VYPYLVASYPYLVASAGQREHITSSVGTNPGIESGGFDSFGDFCGIARRLDSKVKESIPNRHDKSGQKNHLNPELWYPTDPEKYFEPNFKPPTTFL
jgi:hypothetical protein